MENQDRPRFVCWNSCWDLKPVVFYRLSEAQAYTTPVGGPNRITSFDGREWVSGAVAGQAPWWWGFYLVKDVQGKDMPADRRRAEAMEECRNMYPDLDV